ncbi:ribonuclease III [Patescibacteria group bacterium]|nr:ribonuclease III [Patescibacteria group bacterium]
MSAVSLEKKIKYTFSQPSLLQEALTHRSYLNENPSWKTPHNERLEFLGDAVLELVVTEDLYARFPHEPEGKLTTLRAALVNYQILAAISAQLDLEGNILMSKGEAKDRGRAREVILANAMEALIGALYLDGGMAAAKPFIDRFILPEIPGILAKGSYKDPKSLLQEKLQATKKMTPVYKLIMEKGPDHKKVFVVGVYLGEEELARGEGMSKQDAEIEAAKKALENR